MSDAEDQKQWTNGQLDAAYAAFQAHARGSEFNEFGEHVCSECGYAYSWPEGDKGRYHVEYNRSKRHIARAALEAARANGSTEPHDPRCISLTAGEFNHHCDCELLRRLDQGTKSSEP